MSIVLLLLELNQKYSFAVEGDKPCKLNHNLFS